MFRFIQTFLLVGLLASSYAPQARGIVVFQNNFESNAAGAYSVSDLAAGWNDTTSNDGVDEGRVSITDDADAFGSKSLVVEYPQGESNNGKSQWKMDLGGSYDELFLSYRIRFDENFDFVRGGKLPGLCGGACNSGGSRPNGFDGWSARMMWRTDGSGSGEEGGSDLSRDQANIVQYVYHPDQTTNGGTNGDDLNWNDTTPSKWQLFDSDQWYHLQHRVVMNTPGQHDGIVQAWLDGEMVLDVQDIRFREIASLQIDTLYFSTFFGGSSSIWETTKDEYVYYDDFVVATEFITIPGDFDENGTVDGGDLTAWSTGYGTGSATHSSGDSDDDNDVDGSDYLAWQRAYQPAPALSQLAQVPEPSAVCLALTAFGILIARQVFPLQ